MAFRFRPTTSHRPCKPQNAKKPSQLLFAPWRVSQPPPPAKRASAAHINSSGLMRSHSLIQQPDRLFRWHPKEFQGYQKKNRRLHVWAELWFFAQLKKLVFDILKSPPTSIMSRSHVISWIYLKTRRTFIKA
ncbi:uncharacterized protein LAJ45_01504 [Morchella importuna]|uniref:uncharacterized protein n=1 Tax=Morchella importuna TaxID=1174673 RepID=UPI001E8EB3DF|nr:uncharacterized protein LAJ45_01504 [Morchella importuna]KAH8154971.1 hypothetical protein LAJ45_01504 [Morchella importuna]